MLRRIPCFIVLLLIAIASQAVPSSKYTMIVTFVDGHTSKYTLSNQPKLLWENDSVFITSGKICVSVGNKAFHSIMFTEEAAGANGDVNGDGTVDTQDVLNIYEFMKNGTSQYAESTLDINGDGNIDTQDVLLVYEAMNAAAKRRAIPSKASSGIDQMVVVSLPGYLHAYNVADSPSITRDNLTDSLTLRIGNETRKYAPDGIKQVYFEDKAIVDGNPYKVPQTNDYVNPNLITSDSVAYEVTQLDTIIGRARLTFEKSIPEMYVGQIYIASNDSMGLGMYLLTADPVDNHTVDIRFRTAYLTEMLYNSQITITSNPDDPYLQDVEVKLRDAGGSRRSSSPTSMTIDPVAKVVKSVTDIANFFKDLTWLSSRVSYEVDINPILIVLTGEPEKTGNELYDMASKLKYASVVLSGTLTRTHTYKFNTGNFKSQVMGYDREIKKIYSYNNVVFTPAGVPVWYTLDCGVWAFAEAVIEMQFLYASKEVDTYKLAVGVEYSRDYGLRPITKFSHTTTGEQPVVDSFIGRISGRVSPYFRFNAYLYHLLGIHADVMPFLDFDAAVYNKLNTDYHYVKTDYGLALRGGLFLSIPTRFFGDDQVTPLFTLKKDLIKKKLWYHPDTLEVSPDDVRAQFTSFKHTVKSRLTVKGVYAIGEEAKLPINNGTEGAVESQCYANFLESVAKNVELSEEDLNFGQTIDMGAQMAKMRLPEKIKNRMPKFLFGNDKDRYDLVAQLNKEPKAPLRTTKRGQEINVEKATGGLAEGLFKVGEPKGTQCDENSVADVELEWPTPIGYTNVMRTSILDKDGKPIMSIDREMPWEVKNFDAAWSSPGNGHGTIEYRDGGEHVTEVVWGGDGTSVKFIYTRSSGSTTVIAQGYSFTQPQRMLPGTSCMGSPDIPIAVDAEGMHFKGFVCAWDMMYWQAHNVTPNPYAGKASFGQGEHLGYPCKTITTEEGTLYFWQNLCLYALGESTFKVTSLNILDDLENPTVTVHHQHEESE